MNLAETNSLLTFAKTVDNRRFDDATVISWQEILADVDQADAAAAVRQHFQTSTDYLMPVHVINGAAQFVRDRARRARELREHEEQLALEAAPRTDRSAQIADRIRQLIPPGDRDKLFAQEAHWRREIAKGRPRLAEPNPHFAGWANGERP